ncbi:MAG: hypothetical protein ACEPO2_02335 [Pelagibaca sp.]
MTTSLDRLAWGLALLTVLIWAIVPQMATAYPVMMPKAPVVDSQPLPPVPSNDLAEADR